jgi:hypothetical protein
MLEKLKKKKLLESLRGKEEVAEGETASEALKETPAMEKKEDAEDKKKKNK